MNDYFESRTAAAPVVVILRGEAPSRTAELCHEAWDLGVQLVEVPIQSPESVPALEAAVAAARDRGQDVGAGSIHTLEQLRVAIAAGAAFTVAAATNPDVIRTAADHGVPHLPGVATGTEVSTALAAGSTWLKAFPASLLTPAWVSALSAPFPAARFVATGGVNVGNARDFLDAGCRAVAFGSSFAQPDSADLIRELVTP